MIDAATARVGRYPSKAQRGVNCTRAAILGDTNPPDEDHWLYALEREGPQGYAFFEQPPAVLELHEVDWDYKPADVIEAADTHYVVNPDAENLDQAIDAALPDAKCVLLGRGVDCALVPSIGCVERETAPLQRIDASGRPWTHAGHAPLRGPVTLGVWPFRGPGTSATAAERGNPGAATAAEGLP